VPPTLTYEETILALDTPRALPAWLELGECLERRGGWRFGIEPGGAFPFWNYPGRRIFAVAKRLRRQPAMFTVHSLGRSEREGGWYERCTIDELEPILEPLERGRRPKVPSTVRPEPFAGPELDLKVLELGHLRRQVRRRDEIDASILSGIERARAAGARVGELEQALGSPSWVEPGRFYEDVLWELGDWLQRDPRATAVGAARVVKRVADRYQIPGRNLPLPALTRAEHDERRPWNPGRWPR